MLGWGDAPTQQLLRSVHWKPMNQELCSSLGNRKMVLFLQTEMQFVVSLWQQVAGLDPL